MMTALKLRGSDTDTAWECPASLIVDPDETIIDEANDAREMGSAFHTLAQHLGHDPAEQPEVSDVADRFRVDRDDLDRMWRFAQHLWRDRLMAVFQGGGVEAEMREERLFSAGGCDQLVVTGTIDRHRIDNDIGFVLDWKTGRVEGTSDRQQRLYCWLLFQKNPKVQRIQSCLCYLALGHMDVRWYSRHEIEQWFEDLDWRLRNGLDEFTPGDHCARCRRQNTCPGRRQYNSMVLAAFEQDAPMVELTRENMMVEGPKLAATLAKVKYIEKVCKAFKDALKQAVSGIGRVPAGDGTVLQLTEVKRKRFSAALAWPLLTGEELPDDLAGAVTFSATKLADWAARFAETPKERKRATTELMNRLEMGGALQYYLTTQLRVTKGNISDE